jgi:hypothetical protein
MSSIEMQIAEFEAALAERDRRIAELEAWLNWIPVTERMPAPNTPVLVLATRSNLSFCWMRAVWVPKYFHEDIHFECEGDLDWSEDGERAYWPEGWYEWNNHEETHWLIDDPVTHWAVVELPAWRPTK